MTTDTNKPFKSFGEKIHRKIEEIYGSQRKFAKVIGYTPGHISNWCTGSELPSEIAFLNICFLLKCHPSELIEKDFYYRNKRTGKDEKLISVSADEGLTDEKSVQGITWRENSSPDVSTDQKKDIDEGIKYFEELLKGKLDVYDLIEGKGDNDWKKIAHSFSLLVRSGVIAFIDSTPQKDMEKSLKELFPLLKTIHVIDLPTKAEGQKTDEYIDASLIGPELIARKASQVLTNKDFAGKVVGLGHGVTIGRLVTQQQYSLHKFHGTTWIPLISEKEIGHGVTNQFASSIAENLQTHYPSSKVMYLPYIPYERRSTVLDAVLSEDHNISHHFSVTEQRAYDTLSKLLGAEALFITITKPSNFLYDFNIFGETMPDLITEIGRKIGKAGLNDGATALFLDAVLDSNANPIDLRNVHELLSGSVYGVDMEIIKLLTARNRRVFLLAAGKHKQESVYMAVKNQLVNSLIITAEIAKYIIDKEEQLNASKLSS